MERRVFICALLLIAPYAGPSPHVRQVILQLYEDLNQFGGNTIAGSVNHKNKQVRKVKLVIEIAGMKMKKLYTN
jgi:hypothetical protein